VIVGLDLGHAEVREAEHWLHDLVRRLGLPAGEAGLLACTHLVQAPYPHVAVSLAATRQLDAAALPQVPDDLAPAAAHAAGEHAARRSGRAVVFPGVRRLVGALTVEQVLAASAIERVTVLGAAEPGPAPETLVETRDFVRPQWLDGRLTLVTMPAAGGRVAPFEVPNPTPCCADHA
jgi:hypothetical protein